ncbi:MAG: hypothetical protein AAF808_01425 [Cyanobacteria bacterium P01_D01_bin.2]
MVILFNRFPKIRLLLVTLSAVGLTLGAAPLGYAQDVPTPTPPADGGDFDGAPDPTPGPEVTPEPELSEPLPDDPESDITDPADNLPPEGAGQEVVDPSIRERPGNEVLFEGETDAQSPTETPGDPEPPGDDPVGDGIEGEIEEDPDSEEDPPNSSPRALW